MKLGVGQCVASGWFRTEFAWSENLWFSQQTTCSTLEEDSNVFCWQELELRETIALFKTNNEFEVENAKQEWR